MKVSSPIETVSFSLESLRAGYENGQFSVADIVNEVFRRIKERGDDCLDLFARHLNGVRKSPFCNGIGS